MDPIKAFVIATKSINVIGQNASEILDPVEKFRHFRSLVDENNISNYDRIVMHWMACERSAPGSGSILSLMLESGREIYSKSRSRIRKDDLARLVRCDDLDIVMKCYDLVGVDGSVDISKSKNDLDRIDVYDAYRIDASSAVDVGDAIRNFAKVVIIDGFVETVAEIHQILQRSSEDKMPIVMFARGFSPDVLNTISVNRARQTLDVFPFSIPLEADRVNDMFDLSLMTGAEVISSEKGQLISTIKYDDIPTISYMRYSTSEKLLVLKNDKTTSSVRSHLMTLKERLLTADQYNIENIAKRIKRLTSLVCIVSLKSDARFDRRAMEIREASRQVDHFIRFGSTRLDNGDCMPCSSYDIALQHYVDIKDQANRTVTLSF